MTETAIQNTMPKILFHTLQLNDLNPGLSQEIMTNCGVDISRCLECGKCSGGCSNAHIFDYTPRKVVQMVKIGAEKKLMEMDSLWTCVACQLCIDRCPAGIDIPRIIDYMRKKAKKHGIPATRPEVEIFHQFMLDEVYKRGKVSELYLMIRYNLKLGKWFNDADLGQKMFFKGKLNPIPARVKNIDNVRRFFVRKPGEKGEKR